MTKHYTLKMLTITLQIKKNIHVFRRKHFLLGHIFRFLLKSPTVAQSFTDFRILGVRIAGSNTTKVASLQSIKSAIWRKKMQSLLGTYWCWFETLVFRVWTFLQSSENSLCVNGRQQNILDLCIAIKIGLIIMCEQPIRLHVGQFKASFLI